MLVLPFGYAYGRLSGAAAKDVLVATAAGHTVPEFSRGRSCWERPGQAAEHAVRVVSGETSAEALTVHQVAVAGGWSVEVRHGDGRRWRVPVVEEASEPPRPESCGKAAGTPSRMVAGPVEAL